MDNVVVTVVDVVVTVVDVVVVETVIVRVVVLVDVVVHPRAWCLQHQRCLATDHDLAQSEKSAKQS